ncbi:hypothetical protein IAQ61_009364 [Plenodomus lingam]|uniref:uncharacterized protein n=1 Tax=Leptosphaeria maculans TaxID=5022 RepID=UPI003329A595|nr:hypothetical protein IAQ61_009364 [Plenodomus lingam]
MSQVLFTKAPILRTCSRRSISRIAQSSYHSSSGSKMQAGSAPLRTLFRQTTLRATAIAAQRTSYPLTQQPLAQHRPRTPSPPPPYQARNISLLASTSQWTRFTTPSNTLSSVRTFTSSSKTTFASETTSTAPHPSLAPDAQAAVDTAIEEISDLYGTARDEFEIASEESEKNTMYAPDDRAAAREELDKLLAYYKGVLEGDKVVGDEVKRRVGGRIRELENAVVAMEEKALEHD